MFTFSKAHVLLSLALRRVILLLDGAIAASVCYGVLPTAAQIIPDRTLPNPSRVVTGDRAVEIEGGTQRGGNLFHSFTEFSIPTNGEASFSNPETVNQIVTRVTGGKRSDIDGMLRANGSAHLILINPAGIHFGANARLEIGGAFLGTTARSLEFADGTSFDAVNPRERPLLTVSVPIGLNLGVESGNIQIDGSGHQLARVVPGMSPAIEVGANEGGLRARSLAFVGSEIALSGGIVRSSGGAIEFASLRRGTIAVNPDATGWNLGTGALADYGNVTLTRRALVDSSGAPSGPIRVVARRLNAEDGSVFFAQNRGSEASGAIALHATDAIQLTGSTAGDNIGSGAIAETFATGSGADISLSSPIVQLVDGGKIESFSFSSGSGGAIEIVASQQIDLFGTSPLNPLATSRVMTISADMGIAGAIDLMTPRLSLSDGAVISSIARGLAPSGALRINASEKISIHGFNSFDRNNFQPSILGSSTFGEGHAGTVEIQTAQLSLSEGARISSSTFASGDAGNIRIAVAERIELSGELPGSILPTTIESGAVGLDSFTRQLLAVPEFPTGAGGTVRLSASELRVTDGARIDVKNDGTGNGGQLEIVVGNLLLRDRGSLSATTTSGEGGNIEIAVAGRLQLQGGSTIATSAGGTGNGGNLRLSSPTIAALGNSDLVANAVAGRGGNIAIDTQGLFGIEFRDRPTPQSDITASSQFGLSGTVTLANPEVNDPSKLVDLPTGIVEPRDRLVTGCSPGENRFTVTGRGGLPFGPDAVGASDRPWQDLQDFSDSSSSFHSDSSPTIARGHSRGIRVPDGDRLEEAKGWVKDRSGTVHLLVDRVDRSPFATGDRPETCGNLTIESFRF
jgi:filamentous hemagglutinin family protein